MINILLSFWNFADPLLMPELSRCIKASDKVAMISFAHRPSADKAAYDEKYGYGGKQFVYPALEFMKYGIAREAVSLVHYFDDPRPAMKRKIREADILMFTGGMPDQVVPRLKEKGIYEDVLSFDKVVMGYSAGAIVQLARNFLSPDDDYPELAYMDGLSLIPDDFYIEVHYDHSDAWEKLLRDIRERESKSVYAIGNEGAIVVDAARNVRLLGDVSVFGDTPRGRGA
ncbi:MAG: Peptidase family S51 [Firmicutes bacterium ADurb.Bin248]|nr:MAG: Peptidase family S51 [Firmicutes bacterium ADurb.Bin248]HPK15149.1 Type 1 glutamine amidotransferase-like domain-containing protein [Clostridia bacterium]